MAWIRLDDQIAHHPKCLRAGLSSWLFVGCLGYAQKFLTDGFVPNEAIPTLVGGVGKPAIHIAKLVEVGLLERVDGGYQIHDYLDFNDSAADVKRKRDEDRQRKKQPPQIRQESEGNPSGIRAESEQNPNDPSRARASHPIPSHPIPLSGEKNKLVRNDLAAYKANGNGSNGHGPVNAKSRRPVFSGQRFVVFDWMLEDFERTLGTENLLAFDVHEWFFQLDAQAAKDCHVIPKDQQWKYLQAALLAEARTRGLAIVSVPNPHAKKTAGQIARDVVASIDAKEAAKRRKAIS